MRCWRSDRIKPLLNYGARVAPPSPLSHIRNSSSAPGPFVPLTIHRIPGNIKRPRKGRAPKLLPGDDKSPSKLGRVQCPFSNPLRFPGLRTLSRSLPLIPEKNSRPRTLETPGRGKQEITNHKVNSENSISQGSRWNWDAFRVSLGKQKSFQGASRVFFRAWNHDRSTMAARRSNGTIRP